ncbi:MAG: hypothetical protein HQL52_11795 [Magnetococcales bacterium]|nr:hypothetical protein [Magnetococcales bacterium]
MKRIALLGGLLALVLAFSGSVQAGNPWDQKPFSEQEMAKFIGDYSTLAAWVNKQNLGPADQDRSWMMAGMRYDKDFGKQLKAQEWDAERFFYMLDNVTTGLRVIESQAMMTKGSADLKKKMAEGKAKMKEMTQDAHGQMKAQVVAQKKQIMNNPTIPPHQKRMMLAQMDQSLRMAHMNKTPSWQSNNPWQAQQKAMQKAMEAQQKAMQARQNAWRKQMIQNNPMIPQAEKKRLLDAIDNPVKPLTQEQMQAKQKKMMARMMAQQETEIAKQRKRIENDKNIPKEQKAKMLAQMDAHISNMKTAMVDAGMPRPLIPAAEMSLIKANLKKLQELMG